jgi:hypothetical protein
MEPRLGATKEENILLQSGTWLEGGEGGSVYNRHCSSLAEPRVNGAVTFF